MTTLNLQVSTTLDDGESSSLGSFITNGPTHVCGSTTTNWDVYHRYTGVSGLSGATISTAKLDLYGVSAQGSSGTSETDVFANDIEVPVAPTTRAEHSALARTTALVEWDAAFTNGASNVSPELKTVIQELADSFDPAAITILHDVSPSGGNKLKRYAAEDHATDPAPKLDITFTAAASGSPWNTYAQQQ